MSNGYVKSPMNYIGGKYKLLPQIMDCFPTCVDSMVDLFAGGGDVTINSTAKHRYANDINKYVIGIFQEFQNNSVDYILYRIKSAIEYYELSKTDKEAYLRFRRYYNTYKDPIDLFILMCYSYNNQFRFNSKHEFNNPFGERCFNEKTERNLLNTIERLKDVKLSSVSFEDFDFGVLKSGDFVYADPPYLISCGTYNDGKRGFKGWTSQDEVRLYEGVLDELDRNGMLFALSNVQAHKGVTNEILIDWYKRKGYNVRFMDKNYRNCSYNVKSRTSDTQEVLITNY